MKQEITMSQEYLPVTVEAEVIFLIRLLPDSRKQAVELAIDRRDVLDRSGSMDEPAHGGISKIEALKKAISSSLNLLRAGKDRLTITIFDSDMQVILDPTVISDINPIKKLIAKISTGSSTHLSTPLRQAIDIPVMKDALPKVIVFTDGIVNDPDEASEKKNCYDVARKANQAGITMALFGTGTSYNESFLKKMAELAGRGSYYEHVKQVGDMNLRLEEDLEALKSVQDRDVKVCIAVAPDVEIIEALKYVPQQADLPINGNEVKDDFQGLDIRGQSYLIKARVKANNAAGVFKVADIAIAWQGPTGQEQKNLTATVNFTADENLISPADKTVRNTVLNTAGVKQTLKGQYKSAETLFKTAGNQDMAETVKTLGKQASEDAKRTLRTATVTQAHKDTIVGKTKKGEE